MWTNRAGDAPREAAPRSSMGLFALYLWGGVALVGAGLYLLLAEPGEGAELAGRSLVNLHRLALGQTATVSGVILLAVAFRPR